MRYSDNLGHEIESRPALIAKLHMANALVNELRAEFAKFRAAVPEDIKDILDDVVQAAEDGVTLLSFDAIERLDVARENLLILIGILITRSKEERKKEIVAAVVNFMPQHYGEVFYEEVEEYANAVVANKC